MDKATNKYRIHQCSICSEDTELFVCFLCSCEMCSLCKESHLQDLETIDHDVVIYREKFNFISNNENCVKHSNCIYGMYCEPCKLPICNNCTEHRQHRQMDIKSAYEIQRRQHTYNIKKIQNELLLHRRVLLGEIKDEIKICPINIALFKRQILKKVQILENRISNVSTVGKLNHRCLKQRIAISIYISKIQKYEEIYEQSAKIPAHFLLYIKETVFPTIQHSSLLAHHGMFSMNELFTKEDTRHITESLTEIKITERGTRLVRNDRLLKLMSTPVLHQSITVTSVCRCCYHISCVTSNQIWVSDNKSNLILTNTTGDTLHHLKNVCSGLYSDYGVHTVNSQGELIYIDMEFNINVLSTDMKTTKYFLKRTNSKWKPRCVYFSKSTGYLLVGMFTDDMKTGKVTRFNGTGNLTQTIQRDNTNQELYKEPHYIAENNNGDVVVSDRRAVVVTCKKGIHRFSYKRHPSGSGLEPRGICTDALSHILLCDGKTYTVQMIDKNGHFMAYLLSRPSGIFTPWCLSYDVFSHRLWVGSLVSKKVCVYRYITRLDCVNGKSDNLFSIYLT